MKNQLTVKIVTFQGASESLLDLGKTALFKIIDQNSIQFSDQDPDIIYFLSGGSEQSAIQELNAEKHYLLLTSGYANAYASATEVKGYCDRKQINATICALEQNQDLLKRYIKVQRALNSIKGQKLGLIGSVSNWLVNSDIPKDLLQSKLGIERLDLPWEQLPFWRTADTDPEFIEQFGPKYSDQPLIADSSRIYTLLNQTITDQNLDAITVECFSLVKKYHVTGCLALTYLNDHNIPAACEGDIVSGAGLIIAKALTGVIPWMANLAALEDHAFFAHCTGPTNIMSEYTIDTHFETGEGTAIKGKIDARNITIFRIGTDLNTLFVTEGEIINFPDQAEACRTQIEVALSETAMQLLREHPLGNHHLILPGLSKELFILMGKLLGWSVLTD